MDQTPLPDPVPYHLADRTSRPSRLSSGDIDLTDPTRVEDQPLGSQGARRISSLIGESRGVPNEVDLASELDTRQRPRIPSDELRKITEPPPTAPLEVVDPLDDLELETPPPRDPSEIRGRHPLPRGSDDALTPPRISSASLRPSRPSAPPSRPSGANLPRVGPPRTSSRPPVVAIPPKTSSRPPMVSIPPKHDSRPPGSQPPARLRAVPPAPPGARSGMSRIQRDSEDEMTRPRDRSPYDDDDE